MKNTHGNVMLITGASSGIGKSLAVFFSKNGYKVYGTSRKARFDDGEESSNSGSRGGFLKMIPLDVCDEESVKSAVNYICEREGGIDILINNAGWGIAGSVEDTSTEEVYNQFNTNFFGAHRMCRNVLPFMRQKKKGLIINISSVAGVISLPFQSMYSASKYALEAMSEALRIEVKPFGIKVVLIEPGDTRTGFTDSRQAVTGANGSSAYKEKFSKSIEDMARYEREGHSPDAVVKVAARVLKMKNPPVRIAVGFSYKAIVFIKRFIPSRLLSFAVDKLY